MLSSFAGGQFFGARMGTGPARILALHGWGRSHRDFDAVLGPDRATAKHELDAVAVDLPGFGATPPPGEVWGSLDYARAAVSVVEEMEGPVVLLGHSFGGCVALQLSGLRPELVGALVLTGVPRLVRGHAPSHRPPPAFRLARGLHRLGVITDERMEAARQRYGSADYRAATGVMRQVLVRVLGESYEAQLRAIACPVSFVWGESDTASPPDLARAASELVVRSELTVCPGVGHLTPLEAPSVLRAALERYVAL